MAKRSPSKTICIGGEAGQGLVTIGKLLCKALVRSGYHIVVTQSYQSRIRGGHNDFFIRTSADPVAAPSKTIDLLIALDQASISEHGRLMNRDGLVVLDTILDPETHHALKVPFKDLAGDGFLNIAALTIAGALLGLNEPLIQQLISDTFHKKDKAILEENLLVSEKALKWIREAAPAFEGLPPVSPKGPRRLMLNGNEAIALGAIAAGVRSGFFYPMTPATSIMLTFIQHARTMGMVFEQAEDEIAAVNMAIGASFCGAPSLVATSGGGFALMSEGISLAAMTETPLVIAVAQRPGPATGLPTRTEQGDLLFVLHSGHGEFPRAIFTPGNIEECFSLTQKAFEVSEKSQGPAFILTDQFLADSYRAVLPFDRIDTTPFQSVPHTPDTKTPYQRYALTPDGVSPRLYPGMSHHLVIADSDEHTEDGHITEDLSIRKKMVEKRLKKTALLLSEHIPPSFTGDSHPHVLFICWGSTKGAVEEAAERLRTPSLQTATLHFSQVWPLAPNDFLPVIQSAGVVVSVEGNATGQFVGILQRETGLRLEKQITRYDGLPLTPSYILSAFEKIDEGH